MHTLTMSFAAVLLAISMVTGLNLPSGIQFATRDELEARGYTISDMVFKGYVGGHYIEHNGTIQEVITQTKKLYPDFDPEHMSKNQTHINPNHNDPNHENPNHLNPNQIARSGGPGGGTGVAGHICCPVPGQWFYSAHNTGTTDNINYLRDVDGWCGVGGGPGNCIRVAATHVVGFQGCASVYLCNDLTYFRNFDCGYVAQFAEDLRNQCTPFGSPWMCGQQFDFDSMNVFVSGDRC